MDNANKIALIIGIDVYEDKDNLDQLPACKKDAEDLSSLLSSSRLNYNVYGDSPIIGSNLKKADGWIKIRETIGNFFLNAKPSQTLLFYFSGHGIPMGEEVFLGTPQIDIKKPLIKGFSLSELATNMSYSKSKRLVAIIDACYSGAAKLPDSSSKRAKSKAAKNNATTASTTYDKIWKRVPKAEGRYLLLSSQAYERSWATYSNSIYTKYLIQGLRGVKFKIEDGIEIPGSGSVNSGGFVTPELLHNYVYNKILSEIDQQPRLKLDQSSDIILAYHRHLAKSNPITMIYPGRFSTSSEIYSNDYIFENLHIYSAHNEVKGRSKAKIAIMSVGSVDKNHDAIKTINIKTLPNKDNQYNSGEQAPGYFDYTNYNTSMCALIGSLQLENSFIGVAPYSELTIYGPRFINENGHLWNELIQGISRAIDDKPQIMLINLGSTDPPPTAFKEKVNEAIASGILVIAPVGNDASPKVSFPAAYTDVLSVSSITPENIKTSFSSYGKVDICCYGTNIMSTISGNKWEMQSGTSVSSTIVTGGIALMYSINPHLKPYEVFEIIRKSADDIDHKNPEYAGLLGAGKLNVYRALMETKKRIKK